MPDITVSPPALDLKAYFAFKEPVLTHIRNKLNTNEDSIELKVIGINSLRAMMESELRDPYVDTYRPMGIAEIEYRRDLLNSVPLYVFAHVGALGRTTYFKCPLNYISDYSLVSDILYTNRVVVLDMGKLPKGLDVSVVFEELSDLIFDRTGVRPQMKEVSVGEPEGVTREDFHIRESIRTQGITVNKSNKTLLAEITLKHDQLMTRLTQLNIVLG